MMDSTWLYIKEGYMYSKNFSRFGIYAQSGFPYPCHGSQSDKCTALRSDLARDLEFSVERLINN